VKRHQKVLGGKALEAFTGKCRKDGKGATQHHRGRGETAPTSKCLMYHTHVVLPYHHEIGVSEAPSYSTTPALVGKKQKNKARKNKVVQHPAALPPAAPISFQRRLPRLRKSERHLTSKLDERAVPPARNKGG